MACAAFIGAMFILALIIWSIVCCCRACGKCKKKETGWSNKPIPNAVLNVNPFVTPKIHNFETAVDSNIRNPNTKGSADFIQSNEYQNETQNPFVPSSSLKTIELTEDNVKELPIPDITLSSMNSRAQPR